MIKKILEQQEIIKGMQNNEESLIKIMKEYEQLIKKYNLMKTNAEFLAKRIDRATYFIKNATNDRWKTIGRNILLNILKGEDK